MSESPAHTLRVLFVTTAEPWPLDHGGRLHVHHVLRQVASAARVTLVLPEPPRHLDRLPGGVDVAAVSFADCGAPDVLPGAPLALRLARRHFGASPALQRWLQAHATPEHFDVALLHGARLGTCIDACRVPVVWNVQDELVLPAVRALRAAALYDWPRRLRQIALCAAFERCVMNRAAATVFVSRVDADWARRCKRDANLAVIENGVDAQQFPAAARPAEAGCIAFVGALDFEPNIDAVRWFTRHVWPAVARRGANRRFLIVGRNPDRAVRALSKHSGAAGIEVHADVPDVRPYLERAAVIVVPVRQGGGLKNKILEACSVGRPVVATPAALGGLSARPGVELIVARSEREWRRAVQRLLGSPQEAARIAANGHAWVRANHDWRRTGERFVEILTQCAARRPAGCRRSPSGAGSAARATVAASCERHSARTPEEAACR